MPTHSLILPYPPPIPGLLFRHFRGESDYASLAAVLSASEQADHSDRRVSGEDLSEAYAHHLTNCDPYTDMILAEVEGSLVGYARGWWQEESPALRLYHHNAFLLPGWRRKGIGSAMFGWIEDRLQEIARTHPPESEKFFQVNVTQFQTGAARLVERHGYQPVHHYYLMVRQDLENIPDYPLPAGLEIRLAAPEHYRSIWESMSDPEQEEWGSAELTEEAYQEWLADPLFQPHLWQIAWDKETGKPVGHVLTYINHVENGQFDRLRGYTEGIGVAREWRRRGVARALISRSLQAQKAAGMTESALVADRDSSSNVTTLYESCGFQIVKFDTVYRRKV